MEPQVGHLGDQVVARRLGQQHLDRLLADLALGALARAREQAGDVGPSSPDRARCPITSASSGSTGAPSPKHDTAPVWHVGPAGCARIRIASPSQSARISTTRSTLPDVSPLRHSRSREREWKCASPVRMVASIASAST